jgi:RES domain-containing protein
MKLTELAEATVYRNHVPRWAVAPTSGAGAGKHGGRVNRPGVEALYLALETETAIREYQQVSTLLPPGTLTSYQLTVAPVVDFTGGLQRVHVGTHLGRLLLRLA